MPYRVYMLIHPEITTINHAFAFCLKLRLIKIEKKNSRTQILSSRILSLSSNITPKNTRERKGGQLPGCPCFPGTK